MAKETIILKYFLIYLLSHQAAASASSSPATNETLDDYYGKLVEGNVLWTPLLKNCLKNPTVSCIRTNIFNYLKNTFDYSEDVEITSFLKFAKNSLNYGKLKGSVTILQNQSNEINNDEFNNNDISPLEEISRTLHDNTVKFLMTHDLEFQLPDTFFEGTKLKLSPRSLQENGAVIKLEIEPKEEETEVAEGRIFFKKIKKFVGEKLMYALMAILLVIKMVAVKFLFILPTILGAAAAKKLVLKILLFVFPALHHFFKWCAYVPHGTKLHHHKHYISHIHHIGNKPHGPHHHPSGHYEVIAPHSSGPPSLHHFSDKEAPHETLYHPEEHQYDFYPGGSSIPHDVIANRHDPDREENEVHSWGQGQPSRRDEITNNRPLTPTEIEKMILKTEKEAKIKQLLQQERNKIRLENLRLQEQLTKAIKIQDKLRRHSSKISTKILPVSSTYLPEPTFDKQIDQISIAKPDPTQNYVQNQLISIKSSNEISGIPETFVPQKPSTYQQEFQKAAAITFDPFYSPILEKIDNILNNLGFGDEGCRERLICSMYKNPMKFSPSSNLLSAELSRDSKDLQKPSSTNAAVVRFYKYVQAARDGQDKRDCHRLYAACTISTE